MCTSPVKPSDVPGIRTDTAAGTIYSSSQVEKKVIRTRRKHNKIPAYVFGVINKRKSLTGFARSRQADSWPR